MIASREKLNENDHLITDEGDFEKMSKFKYLGVLVIENNEAEMEAKHKT